MQRDVNDLATGHFDVADVSGELEASVSPSDGEENCVEQDAYWSKKGSKMMTSSPGSMKAMKALNMPKHFALAPRTGKSPEQRRIGDARTLICTCRDSDLGLRVDLTAPEWRVGVGNSFLQTRTAFGWAVLVALDTVQRLFGCV